jgi:hypothetical protein
VLSEVLLAAAPPVVLVAVRSALVPCADVSATPGLTRSRLLGDRGGRGLVAGGGCADLLRLAGGDLPGGFSEDCLGLVVAGRGLALVSLATGSCEV